MVPKREEIAAGQPEGPRFQFDLRSLIVFISAVATFVGAMNWIFCTKQLGTFEDVPLFFIPNIPLLGLGIIVVPMACLAMLTRIAFLFVHSVPRLYTIPLFLGMAVVPLLIGATGWSKTDYSLRWLVAVVISAFTVFGEILLRRLPKPFFEAAVLSLATSIGIYFFLMCVVISASI